MKKSLAISLLLVLQLSWLGASAQVHYKKFGLMKAGNDTGSQLNLGESVDRMVAVLGPYTRTSSFYGELADATFTLYHYNNCQLYFLNNEMVRYELKDGTLVVGEDYDSAFRVGNLIGQRKVRVPGPTRDAPPEEKWVDEFYDYKLDEKPGTARNMAYRLNSTSLLKDNTNTFEGYFQVLFNQDKKIFNICLESE